MRLARVLGAVGAAALLLVGFHAQAGSIPVGGSSLIGVLDYSDSFTITDQAGLLDRPDGVYGLAVMNYGNPANGVPGEGQYVENSHGNTPRLWTDYQWSINTDASAIPQTAEQAAAWGLTRAYPGPSGGGSNTGLTQTGAWAANWGIEYGQRDRFVVQWDAVQTADRIDIGIGTVRDDIFANSNVTLFFRQDGSPFADIGLFVAGIGEVDTGLSSPISSAHAWHNYAALFDIEAETIEVFVDEASLGVIDVNAVGGNAFANVVLSNAAVNVGYYGDNIFWSDNFQVGSPIPEPSATAMLLAGLFGLGLVRRRKV